MRLANPSDYNDGDIDLDEPTSRPARRDPLTLQALPYRQYLESPEWRQTRRQKINLAGYRCERCGALGPRGDRDFEVHHLSYARLGFESLDEDLECLCWVCHRREHILQQARRR